MLCWFQLCKFISVKECLPKDIRPKKCCGTASLRAFFARTSFRSIFLHTKVLYSRFQFLKSTKNLSFFSHQQRPRIHISPSETYSLRSLIAGLGNQKCLNIWLPVVQSVCERDSQRDFLLHFCLKYVSRS
jgi:hypothetical protein